MANAPVFSLLAASSAVTAIIGTNPVRCYPCGYIPEATGTDPHQFIPCVTWLQVAGTPENVISEKPPVDNRRIQIDCWSTTYSGALALGDAVRAALESAGNCASLNGDDFDSDVKLYRISFDFSFWTSH